VSIKAGAAAGVIDISAEENAAERTHQEAGAERHEGQHQLGEFAAAGKERLADGGGVIAEHEEVVHFQKISARYADDRHDLLFSLITGERRHLILPPRLPR